jgi:hypothetical protein
MAWVGFGVWSRSSASVDVEAPTSRGTAEVNDSGCAPYAAATASCGTTCALFDAGYLLADIDNAASAQKFERIGNELQAEF